MIRILKFLFTGDWHLHKWKVIEEKRLWDEESKLTRPVGTRRYCQCEVCGTIKIFDP